MGDERHKKACEEVLRPSVSTTGPAESDKSIRSDRTGTNNFEEVSDDIASCLSCRIVSGGGLVGAGIYLISQTPKQTFFGRAVLSVLSAGCITLGSARIFNQPPFAKRNYCSRHLGPMGFGYFCR